MLRIAFLLVFLLVSLFAQKETENCSEENVEIFAKQVDSKNNIAYARGGVVVIYKGNYFSANEVSYDKNRGIVTLDGNINALKGAEFHALGSHIELDLKKETRVFKPLFLLEQKSGVWMSTSLAEAKKVNIHLSSGIVSGCDPVDPLWKLYFSSAEYNQANKWMQMYNVRLHLYNIPILYLPYFAYPTDTTRRSGLLFPSFGYSKDEGLFYEQPIYLAPYDNWDLEFRPQLRSLRGKGLYSTLRFVDSKVSKGSLTGGYFKESGYYATQNNLAYKTHYGFDFTYNNVNWLDAWFGLDSNAQSEFFTDIQWMNDVDYINLSSSSQTNDAAISKLSVINMFYNQEKNYVGAYFKYFLDLTKQNNDNVMQNIPSLQYHHSLESYFDNYFYYNVDVRIKNYYRKKGINADDVEVALPLTLQSSFFHNYLDVSYTLYNSARVIKLYGEDSITHTNDYKTKGLHAQSQDSLKLGSSLTKSFSTLKHNINLSVEYKDKGSSYDRGYYKDIQECNTNLYSSEFCSFYNVENRVETTNIELSQYLFSKKDSRQILYHKLKQFVSFEGTKTDFKALENEFEWRIIKNFSFYSDSFFNHTRKLFTQSYNRISYHNDMLDFSVGNFYSDEINSTNKVQYENYYITDAEYRYNTHYKYFAKYLYDVEHKAKKGAEIGFLYSKRCWEFGLRYLENLRPILTNDGTANAINDKFVYMTIMFKPMGGSELGYKVNAQRN